MTESVGGVAPIGSMLDGMRADITFDKRDPSGESFMRLLDAVERHATLEAGALGHYEHLAQASNDPVIALVMRLILEDEERHHGLLIRMASTLRDALNWTYSADSLPRRSKPAADGEDLASLALELIEEERAGAEALRHLAEGERCMDGGLGALLLDMMAMDSEKHARLLRFVHRRLKARQG